MYGNAASGIQQKSINCAGPANNTGHLMSLTARDIRMYCMAAAAAAVAMVFVWNKDYRHHVVEPMLPSSDSITSICH